VPVGVLLADPAALAVDDQLALLLLGKLAATCDCFVLGVERLALVAGDLARPGIPFGTT